VLAEHFCKHAATRAAGEDAGSPACRLSAAATSVVECNRRTPAGAPHSARKHAIRARRAALEHALQPAVPPRHRRPAV